MNDANTARTIADQGYFFAGGRYVEHEGATIRTGQMFVQYQIPAECTRPFPIVMFHGGGQTGTNYLGTPDGRTGWTDYFLAQGSSYHAAYDHGTSKYLAQAGVEHTFLRLPEIGIRGNAHMMMLEENNLEVAAVLHRWLAERVVK